LGFVYDLRVGIWDSFSYVPVVAENEFPQIRGFDCDHIDANRGLGNLITQEKIKGQLIQLPFLIPVHTFFRSSGGRPTTGLHLDQDQKGSIIGNKGYASLKNQLTLCITYALSLPEK